MTVFGAYPRTRMRRFRQSEWVRALVREHQLSPSDLVQPLFIVEGRGKRETIANLPGIERVSIDLAVELAKKIRDAGIPAVALFPHVDFSVKDSQGSEALNPNNLIVRTVEALKAKVPNLGIICDVALDPYTDHGHDGVLDGDYVSNDASVDILVQQALVLAESGCDVVAPSDMMDGRVGAIRKALEESGHVNTLIMSYAVKYASKFYGPFREAVGSQSLLSGMSKESYQMDVANVNEALREVALDIEEGADFVMVKPGLPYLDVLRAVRQTFSIPVFAYQVSGEYAMLVSAAEKGVFDRIESFLETLIAFKRAGASAIFTYVALDVAPHL